MASELTTYLHSLARRLHLEPGEEQDILLELEGHLEDKAAELEAQGLDRETAYQLAVQEMGAPGPVASGLYNVHSPSVWRDVILATLPHFLLASLFALHLWSQYFLVTLLVIGVALVTWKNWRAGNPSKWSYSWMGYSLAAPTLSWLLALITLSYGAWTLVTTGHLPFNVVLFFLLVGYIPFSMWIVFRFARKVMRRDWLLASLTALPFPFLTSWVLFLDWQGGLWSSGADGKDTSDTSLAFIFLALAVTTAVFLKIGPRPIKIGLLTLTTAILVTISAVALPVSLSVVAVLMMIVASVVFLLSPAVVESKRNQRQSQRGELESGGEVVTHWFCNTT
jgi:hypothetical protein